MKIDEIEEWGQNPITIELKRLVVNQLQELGLSMADAYHPFEPQKTQEILANLNAAVDTWEMVGTLLSGDWSYFDEEDNEPIGDISTSG